MTYKVFVDEGLFEVDEVRIDPHYVRGYKLQADGTQTLFLWPKDRVKRVQVNGADRPTH